MYTKSSNIKYDPSQAPQQHFYDILTLTNEIVNTHISKYPYMKNLFAVCKDGESIESNLFSNIKKHVVFEIYYSIYLICIERKPLSYYFPKYEDSDKLASDPDYASFRLYYAKFRQAADETAQYYHNDQNISIYKSAVKKYIDTHDISFLDALMFSRIKKDKDISYLINNLLKNTITSSKRVSSYNIEQYFASGINNLYASIKKTNYEQDLGPHRNYFFRSVDFYQFEKNCSIELSYMSAYAISNKKLCLEDQKKVLNVLRGLRICPLIDSKFMLMYTIQNKAVWLPCILFPYYTSEKLTILNIRDLYTEVNLAIYKCTYEVLRNYFNSWFRTIPIYDYFKQICLTPQTIKKELNLHGMHQFMCPETESFFSSFFGKGQHITEKDFKQLKLKNFREMYLEDDVYL